MAAFLREQAGRTGQKNWLRQEKSQTAGGKIFQATSKVREEMTQSLHNGITMIRDALPIFRSHFFGRLFKSVEKSIATIISKVRAKA